MLIPINFAKEGEVVTIDNILIRDNTGKKLREMGLASGNKIEVVKNDGSSVIIGIGESRLALDMGVARKIIVVA
ncbi:ferrous iron transport protein A [Clostridium collagenovorans DSM 3089]|uniref:Ferrous iron transport protein A n=1 Tax=Clostridium collagenovorans DSM 3089 TaxID=1121306 RepID=A0A1M5X3W1_9CLOT|nr:FeoA family protein [Clostridium collagenovorans]SHH94471.1 ferrous iron transport protein A [Clostridium collagenovorans DSM 3089]